MLNKSHKQTNLKFDMCLCLVRGSGLTIDKVIKIKNLEGHKNCECYVSKRI